MAITIMALAIIAGGAVLYGPLYAFVLAGLLTALYLALRA